MYRRVSCYVGAMIFRVGNRVVRLVPRQREGGPLLFRFEHHGRPLSMRWRETTAAVETRPWIAVPWAPLGELASLDRMPPARKAPAGHRMLHAWDGEDGLEQFEVVFLPGLLGVDVTLVHAPRRPVRCTPGASSLHPG